ncbi:MAG: 50S ribosomal protein L21 [Gaiellaceae bacterium MAG52_C11]|nr:50S ribosomal protein L21 [Candidatus Gaiellasilicea maunaloa]
MSSYAIISVGGKQYRVHEGERLLVDRLPHGEGKTFEPTVLLTGGGDGGPNLAPSVTVTARVVADVKGEKIRIGKYRPKKGYKKHTGFRASLSQIQIESIGASRTRRSESAATVDAPTEPERVKGMPAAYDELTVAEIKEQSTGWNRPMLEAALEYEQANAARKGALAALESALASKEDDS